RRAFYRAVAARELGGLLEQAKSAAETASELARRLGETGAMNKLDQTREQVFYAEVTAQLATARQRAASERERLTRLMGLWGGDLDFKLPDTLPTLPRPKALPAIETEPVRRRVDLQVARIDLNMLAKSYDLTNATRFINLLEVSGISKTQREADGARGNGGGVEVEFQVPIFDFGEVRVRQAEQTYMQAANRLVDKAVRVARGPATPIATIVPTITFLGDTRAKGCRRARATRTKRRCAMAPCRSTCLHCSRRRGSGSMPT